MKSISIIISIIGLTGILIAAPLSYGKVQKSTENNKEDIIEVKEDMEKIEAEVDKEENVNVKQTVLLEEMQRAMQAQQQLTQLMILEFKK